MGDYKHVQTINEFCAAQGYKIVDFKTIERRNRRGAYSYAEVKLVIPHEEGKPHFEPPKSPVAEVKPATEEKPAEMQAAENTNSAEAQKEEVIKNEV